MFKLPITYTGFDGKEKKKDFYFNLSKGEIAEMNYTIPGGFDGFLSRLNDEPNVKDVIETFKQIILKSYGKRTAEGKFIKSKEYAEEFAASDAYSELFLKFISDENDFVNTFLEGILSAPVGTINKMIEEHPELTEAKEELLKQEEL